MEFVSYVLKRFYSFLYWFLDKMVFLLFFGGFLTFVFSRLSYLGNLDFLFCSVLTWVLLINYYYFIYFVNFLFTLVSIFIMYSVYFICLGHIVICFFQVCIFFAISYFGVGLMEVSIELLRVLIFFIFRPTAVFLVPPKGFEITPIFLFEPIIRTEFVEAGFLMGAPFFIESLTPFFVHIIFQFYWVIRLIVFYIVEFIIGFIVNLIYVLFFFNSSLFRWFIVVDFNIIIFSVIGKLVAVLLCGFFVISFFLSFYFVIITFFNLVFGYSWFYAKAFFGSRASIFFFFFKNRAFGLDFFPRGSFVKLVKYSLKMRYSIIADWSENAESLIIFTSEFRVDPNQLELDTW